MIMDGIWVVMPRRLGGEFVADKRCCVLLFDGGKVKVIIDPFRFRSHSKDFM